MKGKKPSAKRIQRILAKKRIVVMLQDNQPAPHNHWQLKKGIL
jgi:hypothetical protein